MDLSSPNELQAEVKEFICQWDKLSFKRNVNDDSAVQKDAQLEIFAGYSVSETVFLFKLGVTITRPSSIYEFALLVGYEFEAPISFSHEESIQLVVGKLGPIAFELLNQEIARLDSYSMESTAKISARDQFGFWDYFRNQPEEEVVIGARSRVQS